MVFDTSHSGCRGFRNWACEQCRTEAKLGRRQDTLRPFLLQQTSRNQSKLRSKTATHAANSEDHLHHTMSEPHSPTLLGLPAELRVIIYEEVVHAAVSLQVDRRTLKDPVALVLICRKVYDEAMPLVMGRLRETVEEITAIMRLTPTPASPGWHELLSLQCVMRIIRYSSPQELRQHTYKYCPGLQSRCGARLDLTFRHHHQTITFSEEVSHKTLSHDLICGARSKLCLKMNLSWRDSGSASKDLAQHHAS